MDLLKQLYDSMTAENPVIAHRHERDVDFAEFVRFVKADGRTRVYSGFTSHWFLDYFSNEGGAIISTSYPRIESDAEARAQLKDIQTNLAEHGLVETPGQFIFLVPILNQARFWFTADKYHADEHHEDNMLPDEATYLAWIDEISTRKGFLVYTDFQTGCFGEKGRKQQNEQGYRDAFFDFITTENLHLFIRLPEDKTLVDVLKDVPERIPRMDFSPFELYSRAMLQFWRRL